MEASVSHRNFVCSSCVLTDRIKTGEEKEEKLLQSD